MNIDSEKTILAKLRTGNSASYELLYKYYFPSIASFIKQNQGRWDEAEDIFQESVIILLQKVRQPDFVLTSSLKTYLFSISKNLWLKRLREKRYFLTYEEIQKASYENIPETIHIDSFHEITREEQVQNWLQKISENCQRILKALFFYQEPMDSLIKKMGWKNKHTAANQKYKCIEQLKKESRNEKGT